MAKNILAFLGLIFLTLLILLGVWILGYLYDSVGIVSLPRALIETPMSFLTPGPVQVTVSGEGKSVWTNPVDALPTAPPTAIPEPTPTPEVPLSPIEYQSQVISRLKNYSYALDRWVTANNSLAHDSSLIHDSAWKGDMKIVLEQISVSGRALAETGPAPDEYKTIDTRLKAVLPETEELVKNYQLALDTQDSKYYVATGDSFTRIKESLSQVADEIVALGWNLN